MFAYCENNPIMCSDNEGNASTFATNMTDAGGKPSSTTIIYVTNQTEAILNEMKKNYGYMFWPNSNTTWCSVTAEKHFSDSFIGKSSVEPTDNKLYYRSKLEVLRDEMKATFFKMLCTQGAYCLDEVQPAYDFFIGFQHIPKSGDYSYYQVDLDYYYIEQIGESTRIAHARESHIYIVLFDEATGTQSLYCTSSYMLTVGDR